MISEEILQEVDRGRLGLNHGIPMGLPKLEGIIDGVCRETYTLIISNSGSGKTSLALYAYVYKPLMEHLDDDNFKVLYFSLEMNKLSLFVKLLSIYIFETYGKEISFKKILSREKDYILDDENYQIVKDCSEWLNKVESKLEIYDKQINAKTVYAILKERLKEIGTFTETSTRLIYTPNNPDLVYNVVIDHIGLIRPMQGSLKQEIDTLSSYLVYFREKCGISPIVIQQANRDQGNIERFKAGKSSFTMNDSKDSGNTVQDSNIMLALYNPFKDSLKSYRGYDLSQLGSNFRSIIVLKNRFGDCDIEIGVGFYGWINYFKELPKPNEIYDYEIYKNPRWKLEDNVKEITEDTQKQEKPKFIL